MTLDMQKVARIMHNHGGLVIFDCAAWASHLPIDMNPENSGGGEVQRDFGEAPDAVVLSPHKLPGGPGYVVFRRLRSSNGCDSLMEMMYVGLSLFRFTRSCPGVLLAKKRILKNAIPSCVGGGVVEYVSRDGAVWIEVSSYVEKIFCDRYDTES